MHRAVNRRMRRQDGQITVLIVGLFAALFLVAGLAVDGGRTAAAKVRAIGDAQEAARTGAQALSRPSLYGGGSVLDPAQAQLAVRSYLAAAGDTGTVTVSGSSVSVTVRIVEPMTVLRAAGVDSLTVTGTGTAQAERAAR